MAWAKFKKCHKAGEVLGELNHCDKTERLKHNHANPHIDKNRTQNNEEWYQYSYEDCKERFQTRIEDLDENGNNNHRPDRIICVSVCITIPKEVKDCHLFSEKVKEICIKNYGKHNIINGYLHVDEIHDYLRRGVVKKSMAHIHCLFVPELDGCLQGTKVVSDERKKQLNEEIEMMCIETFGVPFFGKDREFEHRVEELKRDTYKEEALISLIKDKELIEPVKYDLFTVTLKKKDYDKLLTKAALCEYIQKQQISGLENTDKSSIYLREKFNDLTRRESRLKKKEKSINEKLEKLNGSDELLIRIEEYEKDKENIQSQLLSQRKELSQNIRKNERLKRANEHLMSQNIYLSGMKKLKEEKEKLMKEYLHISDIMKRAYSDIEKAINILERIQNIPVVSLLVSSLKETKSLIETNLENTEKQRHLYLLEKRKEMRISLSDTKHFKEIENSNYDKQKEPESLEKSKNNPVREIELPPIKKRRRSYDLER